LVPQYGNPTFMTCFTWYPYSTRSHHCLLYNFPPFPYTCYSAVQHTCIISLYVLSFCQHWTYWYDQFRCLTELFTVYSCYLFLFELLLSNDILFAMLP